MAVRAELDQVWCGRGVTHLLISVKISVLLMMLIISAGCPPPVDQHGDQDGDGADHRGVLPTW